MNDSLLFVFRRKTCQIDGIKTNFQISLQIDEFLGKIKKTYFGELFSHDRFEPQRKALKLVEMRSNPPLFFSLFQLTRVANDDVLEQVSV